MKYITKKDFVYVVIGIIVIIVMAISLGSCNRNAPQAPYMPPQASFVPPVAFTPEPTENTPQDAPELPDGEYDKDGNNIDDMELGDQGISSGPQPFATYAKQWPTKGGTDYGATLIAYGKKFLGTPYQYGSKRNEPSSFDCSDFTQYVFRHGIGMTIPADSRAQREYLRQNGSNRYKDWKSKVKVGDLMFFMSYKGYKASDYAGIDKTKQTVTHVGIYAGKNAAGKHLLLHTASAPTGVRIQEIDGTQLEYRLIANGRMW